METNRLLEKDSFGELWPYVMDESITDIDINDGIVWTRDINLRRVNTGIVLDPGFVNFFTNRVANMVSGQLNPSSPILESETPTLRFSIIHEASTMTGRSICIRKTLPKVRLTEESAIAQGYMTPEIMNFLANCVKAKMSIVIGGEVGVGKTECIKFLSRYIDDAERIATIEDSPELHYKEIYPGRDCVALKVANRMSYAQAIKATLRQNVSRIILAEARSTEVKDLIECISTGMSSISTVHTDDVRNIPSRFLNMMPSRNDADRLSNDVYTYLDVGILIRAKQMPDGKRKRYVDQVGIFNSNPNRCDLVVKEGKLLLLKELPDKVKDRFDRCKIADAYRYERRG